MTKLALSKRIALIVVFGHIALFSFGLVAAVASPFDLVDTTQMILMGSPLLAAVGLSAFRFMARLPEEDNTRRVDSSWVLMSTVVTSVFIAALFLTYSATLFNTAITATTLKFIVGAIETVLGIYLGVIQETMFPEQRQGK